LIPVQATPGQHPVKDEGLIDHLRSLLASFSAYLGARLQLAGVESKEASAHYLKILLWLLVCLFGFTFGYIFVCISAVFLVAWLTGVSWMWILLGLGLAHIALAIAAVLVMKSKFAQPMFAATIAEFKKDQSWLTQKTH
jgi:uncharacterized membrane protein YqjE